MEPAVATSAAPDITEAPAPISRAADAKPRKLRDLVIEALRVRHYSLRTERAYLGWIKRFIDWSGGQHPRKMGGPDVEAWLSWLATDGDISDSTQRQALSAVRLIAAFASSVLHSVRALMSAGLGSSIESAAKAASSPLCGFSLSGPAQWRSRWGAARLAGFRSAGSPVCQPAGTAAILAAGGSRASTEPTEADMAGIYLHFSPRILRLLTDYRLWSGDQPQGELAQLLRGTNRRTECDPGHAAFTDVTTDQLEALRALAFKLQHDMRAARRSQSDGAALAQWQRRLREKAILVNGGSVPQAVPRTKTIIVRQDLPTLFPQPPAQGVALKTYEQRVWAALKEFVDFTQTTAYTGGRHA